MEILLEEFYKTDLHVERHHDRKVTLSSHKSYQITGVCLSGKTQLVKSYLLGHKKSEYLYIDCNDIRIDIELFNRHLQEFCLSNKIDILVLDNYTPAFKFANVSQLILISEKYYKISDLHHIELYALDYEEFLAYEHKYDSSALNHFLQLGALPVMHTLHVSQRNMFLQNLLRLKLTETEFELFTLCTKYNSLKLSAFTLYERLKQRRKISKDKLYFSFEQLLDKGYIHQVSKYAHPKAVKKLYLCDIAYKTAFSLEKNFGRLFENMVFLELLKSKTECYYEEGVDFYIPAKDEIILCKPFADERRLFKKLQNIEAFLFTYSITKITVITMSKEGEVSHPGAKVSIIPFDIWALGD